MVLSRIEKLDFHFEKDKENNLKIVVWIVILSQPTNTR